MNITAPIKTPEQHREVLARIDEIFEAPSGTPLGDELDVLYLLAEDYERRNHPIGPPDPIEAILFRLDQMGLDQKDLQPLIGSRSRVFEVLNRKRPLTLGMIRKLHAKLGIPAEVLIAG